MKWLKCAGPVHKSWPFPEELWPQRDNTVGIRRCVSTADCAQWTFDKDGYRNLDGLRSAGRISAIGAGVNIWQICERLLNEANFDCFLFAECYMLLEQEPLETFLPLLLKRVVGVILGGPYNLGIFATGAVDGGLYDYALAPEVILQRLKNLARFAQPTKQL